MFNGYEMILRHLFYGIKGTIFKTLLAASFLMITPIIIIFYYNFRTLTPVLPVIFAIPPVLYLISFTISRKLRMQFLRITDVVDSASKGDLSKFILQEHFVKCNEMK